MTQNYPKISVIMPVLNNAATVEKAILSLTEQNYPALEFIVLDGGSTDGTLEIIGKYIKHISHFRTRADEGNAEAMNEGINLSGGEIINQLNADDFYEPGVLLKVGQAFIDNPTAEIINVKGRIYNQNENGEMILGHECSADKMHISAGSVNALYPNCRFFRKELFQKYGPIIGTLNGKMTLCSDYEYLTRFSLFNPVNITLDIVGYNYLSHEGSLTLNNNKYTKLRIYDEKAYYIENLLNNYSHLMDASLQARLQKEYRIAFTRRLIKNIIDSNYREAKNNFIKGVKKYGPAFPIRALRFYVSYRVRLNKVSRSVRKSLSRADNK